LQADSHLSGLRQWPKPKQIAERLNADGIPGPRGDRWRATTLRPDRTRGNGLLQNELYTGRIVHNQTSKVVEPMTRRVRIRPNPPDQWVIEEVPQLRIVDQELWDKVQAGLRRRETGAPVQHRRARHMLSGLGVCGICGGSWNVRTATYWGCGSRMEGSGCTNNRTISTDSYERRVIVGLRERILDPELVEIFVAEYRAEYAKRASRMRRERGSVERRIATANASIERLVVRSPPAAARLTRFAMLSPRPAATAMRRRRNCRSRMPSPSWRSIRRSRLITADRSSGFNPRWQMLTARPRPSPHCAR
jgi:hypothetical protein